LGFATLRSSLPTHFAPLAPNFRVEPRPSFSLYRFSTLLTNTLVKRLAVSVLYGFTTFSASFSRESRLGGKPALLIVFM
jgi:hypothetical protein